MLKKMIVISVIVGLLASTGYFGFRYRQLHGQKSALIKEVGDIKKEIQSYKTDPDYAQKAQVASIIAEVSKSYDLPKNEEPQVATVSDKEKLKDQPFFEKAIKGDTTLIYAKAKLAILYRSSSKQIINVSSVTVQDKPAITPAPASSSTTPTP